MTKKQQSPRTHTTRLPPILRKPSKQNPMPRRNRHVAAVYNHSLFSGFRWFFSRVLLFGCWIVSASIGFLFCCRQKNKTEEVSSEEEDGGVVSSEVSPDGVDLQNLKSALPPTNIRIEIRDIRNKKPPPPPLTLPTPIFADHDRSCCDGSLAPRALAVPTSPGVPQMLFGGLGGV